MSEERIVYKKVRVLKNGNYYSLFIGKTKPFEFGVWMKAKYLPTPGFAPRSLGKDENGNEIGGWHCCFRPEAPHIADRLKSGERRVWMKCLIKGKTATYDRPESQGGAWILAEYLMPLEIMEREQEVA